MTAVALIGCDGAGKTTVAEMLIERQPVPIRYVYMGANPSSSNVALPTTRLVHALKVRKVRQQQRARGESTSEPVSLHGIEHRKDKGSKLWAALRLANRIAEATARQTLSWWYQSRGFLVVYDRHFLFDHNSGSSARLSNRLFTAFLEHVYPRPDLVLFLDAPAEILLARKQEVPASYLESRRRAYLRRGAEIQHFETIDASDPLDIVYGTVADRIRDLVTGDERIGRPGGGGNR